MNGLLFDLLLAVFVLAARAADLPAWELRIEVDPAQVFWGEVSAGLPPMQVPQGITLMTTDSTVVPTEEYPANSTTYWTDNNILTVNLHGLFGTPPSGPNSTDTLAFNTDAYEVLNQSFILKTNPPNLESAFGVGFGLGRIGSGQLPPESCLLNRLVAAYDIPRIVGIWINNVYETRPSQVKFGGSTSSLYNPGNVVTHQLYVPEMLLWNLHGTNVSFGTADLNYNGIFVLDTSSSRIYAPRRIVQTMAQVLNWRFLGTTDDQDFYGVQLGIPVQDFPELALTIDNTLYSIAPNYWTDPIAFAGLGLVRIVGADLFVGEQPIWILGYPFLTTFYSIYDYDAETVSLSRARHFPVGSDPDPDPDTGDEE